MKDCELTVVVTIYKVEKQLVKCLESIRKQTMKKSITM